MIEEEPLDGLPISGSSEESGVVLAELVPPRPWGVWPTLGLSLGTAFAVTIAQMVGGVPVMLYRVASLPAAQRENMAALAEHFSSDGLVLSMSTFVGGLVATGLVVLWSLLRGWRWREYLALRGCSLGAAVPSFIGLAVILAVSHLSLGAAEQQGTDFMVRAYQSAGFLPLFYMALIVVAPFWEELFFRGFMHRGLVAGMGAAPAIIICSTFWALMHVQYNMVLIFWIFLIGLFFGAVRERTGSTGLVILLQSIKNLLAVVETAAVVAKMS